jgi:hypothetical protein
MITLISVVVIILVVVIALNSEKVFFGLNNYQWGLVFGLLYFLSIIFESMLDLNYIYFSDSDEHIILRYFSMSIFNKKKHSIEIPKNVFGGYQLISSYNGIKQSLILREKVKNKTAKYKPVSLASLNKKQLKQIITALEKYK